MDKEILKQAIEKWGADNQIDMIQEECIELALAIQKYKRVKLGASKPIYNNVIDEIADVKIMIAQAELIFDSEAINDRVKFKMDRLEKRIKNN